MFGKKYHFMRILFLLVFMLPIDLDIANQLLQFPANSTKGLLPQARDYPHDCSNYTNPENTALDCVLYHMNFLVHTDTANDLYAVAQLQQDIPPQYRDILFDYNLIRFALFVAPDRAMLWHHAEGSSADVKVFYNNTYIPESTFPSSLYQSGCIEILGEQYGYDFPGNLLFGYLGAHAGFSLDILLIGAGNVQILNDAFIKGTSPLASAGGPDNLLKTYGDQPSDQIATRMGYELYQQCKTDCATADVAQVLAEYRTVYVQAEYVSPTSVCHPRTRLAW